MHGNARWLVGPLVALAACSGASQRLERAVAGEIGTFWDLVAEGGRPVANVYQGFCFLPGRQFYAYTYEGRQRIPYTWGLHDVAPPPGVEANLKSWFVQDSVLTLQGTMKFTVKFMSQDTLRLVTAEHTNTWLLAKSERNVQPNK